ncbi:MAG TPA: D-alanine--D-alanine ligase [Candidatus Saccharimonadales bacterium]|nr:D-alanine--D-alanine ligase [Candidatus Saccharimonadales bacterium]
MNKKIRIAVIFGGKSAEHEVSIQSAKNVVNALDREKYEPVLIGIDKKGVWHELRESLLNASTFSHPLQLKDKEAASIVLKDGNNFSITTSAESFEHIDVVFPVLHGPFGEDGTVQGALQLMNLPYVGSGVLGTAVGMDKDVTKRLLRDAGVSISKFLVFRKGDTIDFQSVSTQLGTPVFVKPANLGSSIGVTKAHNEKEFHDAVNEAFLYDTKILIEEEILGRELEISVLGNENPKVSVAGEVLASHEFYDYDAKYIDDNGARVEIPADISPEELQEMQHIAKKTYQALCLEGMARIDFFLSKEGKFYVNEANTIPGFTNISMYPKLWEASGISYTELIDTLIELAIERHKKQTALQTSL